jgi:hypothetical protein
MATRTTQEGGIKVESVKFSFVRIAFIGAFQKRQSRKKLGGAIAIQRWEITAFIYLLKSITRKKLLRNNLKNVKFVQESKDIPRQCQAI